MQIYGSYMYFYRDRTWYQENNTFGLFRKILQTALNGQFKMFILNLTCWRDKLQTWNLKPKSRLRITALDTIMRDALKYRFPNRFRNEYTAQI